MSDAGSTLDDIHDYCEAILRARLIRTIGFSFHHDKLNALASIEIGYGIHGEPGSMRIERAKSFAPVIAVIADKLRLSEVKSDVVLLFNNLGGASEFIFYQFVREFLDEVRRVELRVAKVYAGTFLTSLSKEALSVTLMEVRDAKVLAYLEHPVSTAAGHLFNSPLSLKEPNVREFAIPRTTQCQSATTRVSLEEQLMTSKAIRGACRAAIEAKHYLNEVDSELGDGDTGSTLARGAESLLSGLDEAKLELGNPLDMLQQMSTILMESMGGTSGAIFSIFFQCASKAFSEENAHSLESWTLAMSLGMSGVMQHGKSKVGDRTLLDALHSGYCAMNEQLSSDTKVSSKDFLESFARGCRAGSESTKSMSPKSGRSCYSLSDRGSDFEFQSKNPDPGAHAIDIIADAVYKALRASD